MYDNIILGGEIKAVKHLDPVRNLWKTERDKVPLIARFVGPTRGPSGADRTQAGPMLVHELCYLGHVCEERFWLIDSKYLLRHFLQNM